MRVACISSRQISQSCVGNRERDREIERVGREIEREREDREGVENMEER